MRIAIISDIHGNLEALNTVLEDIRSKGIDKIYCIGDIIAKGSHQTECLDLVRKNCEVIIKGNCDEYFSSDIDLTGKSDTEINRIKWTKSKLNKDDMNYLINLPFSYEFYMSGRLIRLIHAHPEKIDKFVGNIDHLDKLYSLFLPSENTVSKEKADVLICGHIHTPYVQKIYNRYVINTGSVGNSIDVFRNPTKDGNILNTTVANYLVLSGNLDSKNIKEVFSFELVSVPYDIDKELENSEDNLEIDSYSIELKTGTYRNMDKIYKSFEARGIDKDSI